MNMTDRLMAVKTDKSALFSVIICALLIAFIIYSFIVRVQMYTLGITLWEDEARLAENIVDRSMSGMLTPPLANLQTAPALYLIFVKALTLLFGTSEAVLRLPSFLAMMGLLVSQGLLLRKVFRLRLLYTLFAVAASSTFLYYMQHSNELKPYVGDAMFVLCTLLGYYAYRKGILGNGLRKALLLAAVFIFSMLSSTPATFAIGAVFIVEFLLKCRRRDQRAIITIVICGVIFIAAFALNYFLWLKPIAENPHMVDYWEGFKFSFMMTSKEALSHNMGLIKDVLTPLWHNVWFVLPLAVAGFVVSLAKRNIYTVVIGLFFFIMLMASALDKYPIADRLWLFAFAIIFIYCFVFIDALGGYLRDGGAAKAVQLVIPVFFSVVLLAPNFSFPAYGKGEEWTLVPGDQAKPLISYVRENIREGEILYSYAVANKILKYENGYDSYRIGNVASDNIIYGNEQADYKGDSAKVEAFDADVAVVAEIGDAYVLFYHAYYPLSKDWILQHVIRQFQGYGYMDMLMDVYHTPLYWFTDDISKVRAAATLEAEGLEIGDGAISGILNITNTGATILSPDEYSHYGPLHIVLRGKGETVPAKGAPEGIILGTVTAPIRQGETVGLLIGMSGIEPGEYQIDLAAIGEYYFSELGLAPIPVTVIE